MIPEATQRLRSRPHQRLVGNEGVARIKRARIAVVGLGGIGCPAALYLAAAGVGRLELIDGDTVAIGNLTRQILFDPAQVQTPKVIAGAERLRVLGADVVSHECFIDRDNAAALLGDCDLVIDGCDNLTGRLAISDAARVSVISGFVQGVEARVFAASPHTACLRCLFDSELSAALPSCADQGVLGPAAGIAGTWAASLALAIVTGLAVPKGELHIVNLDQSYTLRVPRVCQRCCNVAANRTSARSGIPVE